MRNFVFQNNGDRKKRKSRCNAGSLRYSHLESRKLLATITVDTTIDDGGTSPDGNVSLREAVMAANTNAPFGDAPAGDATGDQIVFDASLDGSTVDVLLGSIPITEGVVIHSSNRNVTINREIQVPWIFEIDTNEEVGLNGLKFTATNEDGGGVFKEGPGILRLLFTSFTGMGSNLASAVSVTDSSLRVIGSTFTENYASKGGAIIAFGGDSEIRSSTFTRNYAETSGGAIHFEGGHYFISDTDFTLNMARDSGGFGGGRGGAIRINGAATGGADTAVQIRGGHFEGNSSGVGGAIANSSALTIRQNTVFENNRADGTFSSTVTNAIGGAVLNSGQLLVVDAVFNANRAQTGAGVYHAGSPSLFNRVQFFDNMATLPGGGSGAAEGGGLAIVNGNARLLDTTFENNFGQTNGGGIAVYGASILQISGGRITGNTAELYGGGIFVPENSSRSFVQIYNGTLIDTNSTFRANQSTNTPKAAGGGIYSSASLQINNAEIRSNTSTGFGGGIHVQSGFTKIGASSIASNRTLLAGGGINIQGGIVNLFQTTVGGSTPDDGNMAGEFVTGGTRGFGGGINLSAEGGNSRFSMNGGSIANNIAKILGGGINASVAGNIVRLQNNVSISRNQALVDNGGGVYNDEAHLEIRDSIFEENLAKNGAGIFQNDGSANLVGSVIRLNEARRTGGGLFNRGFASRNTSVIENNVATFFPDVFEV